MDKIIRVQVPHWLDSKTCQRAIDALIPQSVNHLHEEVAIAQGNQLFTQGVSLLAETLGHRVSSGTEISRDSSTNQKEAAPQMKLDQKEERTSAPHTINHRSGAGHETDQAAKHIFHSSETDPSVFQAQKRLLDRNYQLVEQWTDSASWEDVFGINYHYVTKAIGRGNEHRIYAIKHPDGETVAVVLHDRKDEDQAVLASAWQGHPVGHIMTKWGFLCARVGHEEAWKIVTEYGPQDDTPLRGPNYPCGEFGANHWAAEFVRRFGGDEALMVSWFANAIMAGYDQAKRETATTAQGGICTSGNTSGMVDPDSTTNYEQRTERLVTSNDLPDPRVDHPELLDNEAEEDDVLMSSDEWRFDRFSLRPGDTILLAPHKSGQYPSQLFEHLIVEVRHDNFSTFILDSKKSGWINLDGDEDRPTEPYQVQRSGRLVWRKPD